MNSENVKGAVVGTHKNTKNNASLVTCAEMCVYSCYGRVTDADEKQAHKLFSWRPKRTPIVRVSHAENVLVLIRSHHSIKVEKVEEDF